MPAQLPLPNFLIAGATRSGTTYLHQALEQHPDVFVPAPKELWFFNVDAAFGRGLDHYRSLFRGWGGEKAVGEATPLYMNAGLLYRDRTTAYTSDDDSAIARIAASLPDARIIVSLRHPRSRLVSQYRKNLNQRKPGVAPTLERHLRETAGTRGHLDFVHMNRYERHLPELIRSFGADALCILIFEEWTAAPEETVRTLFRFLGVDASIHTQLPAARNDAAAYARRRGSLRNGLKRLVRRTPPADHSGATTLSPETETWLAEIFQPGIKSVEEALGRSIPAWHDRT